MRFFVPVKIYEEENCVKNHSKELAAYGKKALIVTGSKSAKLNGSYQDVTKALEAEGVKYVLFDEVEENPSVETVMKARDMGLLEGADFVIGIGGGSPMDAAKAISLMMYHKDEDASFLYNSAEDNRALPIVLIPTTCGTGSEATAVTVLTVHGKRTKASSPHRIFADLSLVDAKYIEGAPIHIIRDTAIDSLGHLWESYINRGATDYSRMFAKEGMVIWSKAKDELLSGDISKENLRNLMNASTIAGMAIAHDGTTIPHGLSYCITYEMGMSHGRAIGRFLSGYVKHAAKEDRDTVLSLSGFKSLDEFRDYYIALCGNEKIDEALIQRTVNELFMKKDKLMACPYEIDKDILFDIVRDI